MLTKRFPLKHSLRADNHKHMQRLVSVQQFNIWVSSDLAIPERTVDSLLQALPGMCEYSDYLLFTGEAEENDLEN